MILRDVLNPNLLRDKRVAQASPVLRRIFANEMYEVFVGFYPGGPLATLVHYKRENLRIMSKLAEHAPPGAEWVKATVGILTQSGKGPFDLIRDAKLETKILLTLHDRAALKMAGVEIPHSAGRFREVFLSPEN